MPNAIEFAKAAFRTHEAGEPLSVAVEREPTNPYDQHAVKVLGWARGGLFFRPENPAPPPRRLFGCGYLRSDRREAGYIDISYFLVAPMHLAAVNARSKRLIEAISDELVALSYTAKSDNKLGRLEHDILGRYAELRAHDLGMLFDDDAVQGNPAMVKGATPGKRRGRSRDTALVATQPQR